MRPARFAYARPSDLGAALRLLGRGGQVLAGGQSLLPQLHRRQASPAALIDVSGLAGLRYVRRDPLGQLSIGALTRHADVERHPGPAIRSGFGVLSEAASLIAHLPVRVRGTIGGSLAHADPTAEWCLVAVGLDARLTLRSVAGARVVPAAEFLTGAFRTDLRPGEMVTEVRFPRPAPAAAIVEHAWQAGHFPVVAAFATVDLAADGAVHTARVAVSGLTDRPQRLSAVEEALTRGASADRLPEAAFPPAAADPAPGGPGPGYRSEVARALVARAVLTAVERARPAEGDNDAL